jgi:hypothetical protein
MNRYTLLASLALAIVSATASSAKEAGGSEAFLKRINTCSAEWKTAKADPAVQMLGWPKFWSACNQKYKETGTASKVQHYQDAIKALKASGVK